MQAFKTPKIFTPKHTYAKFERRFNAVKSALSNKRSNEARGGLPRFFIENLPSIQGGSVVIKGAELSHMTKTLRLVEQDRVELFDGKGGLVEAIITFLGRSEVQLMALEPPHRTEMDVNQWKVAVACGSLKGGRADWLVEKCTELGASELIPLLTQHSPRAGEGRIDRWQRVSLAAAKQSQRTFQLVIREPTPLPSLLQEIQGQNRPTLLAAANSAPLLAQTEILETSQGGFLIIGPEGDFTSEETSELIKSGANLVGLGPRRLRVETAAIALLSGVMLFSDSRNVPY